MKNIKRPFILTALIAASIPLQAAETMTRLQFNAFTTKYPSGESSYQNNTRLDFYFAPYALHKTLGPEDIQSIKIKANGITKTFAAYEALDHLSDAYFTIADSDSFGTPFPTKYTISVTDSSNKTISQTDYINAVTLAPSTLKWPSAGSTVSGQTPTFSWTKVPNAAYYRVMLWDITWNQPVFWNYAGGPTLTVDRTFVKLSKGLLKSNHDYKWNIEARAGEQDLDRRSRSSWNNFSTATW